jgi:tetratricopeptide (TPR) repeat protein
LNTIQRRAEGNPFFVEEIVRMLIDQGVLVKKEGSKQWCVGAQSEDALSELASPATPPEDTLIDQHYILPLPRLPDTIQGVLAARVDLLSHIEKLVLQCASIVGRTFWLSAVLELAEDLEREVVLQTLEQLTWRDFIEENEKQTRGPLEEEESFGFKHVLIRDVVYNNIPRNRRSQKHAQLALWLEEQVAGRQEAFADLLAYHYQQALVNWSTTLRVHTIHATGSELSREEADSASRLLVLTRAELVKRAIRYLTLAGDKAYHGYYTIRAIQAYTEALELLQENDADALTLSRMHRKLGHAYTQRSTVDDAWREYRQALELLQDQPEGAREDQLILYLHLSELSTRWYGWFDIYPDMQDARRYINAGLRLLEGQPPSGYLAELHTYLSMWHVRQFKPARPEQRIEMAAQALSCALEGLRIAEEAQDTISTWIALDALGFIYGKQHNYTEAHNTQHRRQSLQDLIKSRAELYDLYGSLGSAHYLISDYPTAASWFGQAWQVAQTMESPSMLLSSMWGRLHVWYAWNRADEACEAARRMLQVNEQYQPQDKSGQLYALEILAELTYRAGKTEESEQLLRQYKHVYEQYCPNVPMLLPGIHAAHRDWSLAVAELSEIVRKAEPFPAPDALALMAEYAVLANMPAEELEELCARAVRVAEHAGMRKFLAIALRARGRMQLERASWDKAGQDLLRALASFKELDLPWQQGITLICLGQFHQRQAAQPASEHHNALARLYLEQALGFFESLGAVYDTRHARELLEEARVVV